MTTRCGCWFPKCLLSLGYRFIERSDAASAIPVLQSAQPIDLLITDVGLPVMNGQAAGGDRAAASAGVENFVHYRICGECGETIRIFGAGDGFDDETIHLRCA